MTGVLGWRAIGCSGGIGRAGKVEFKILGVRRRKVSRVATLDFKRADIKLLRELVSSVPWESDLESPGAHESFFHSHLLKSHCATSQVNGAEDRPG